jgi:hypothetical protein
MEARQQHFAVEIHDIGIRTNQRINIFVSTNKYDLAVVYGNGLGPGMTFVRCVDDATQKDFISAGRLRSAAGL